MASRRATANMLPSGTRRGFLCALAGALSSKALPARARPVVVSPPSILRADGTVLARDVRNFWGVNVNPTRDQPADVLAGMMDLIGTRRIRCHPVLDRVSNVPGWQRLQTAMIARGMSNPRLGVLAPVVAYMNDLQTTFAVTQGELLKATDLLYGIEGPNEYNNAIAGNGSHGPFDSTDRTAKFAGLFLDWCRALNDWWGAHPALANVLLVAPSLAVGEHADAMSLANVSGLVHLGNAHFYAGRGRQPSFGLAAADTVAGNAANVVQWARMAQMGDKPIIVSECGATTDGKNYARNGISQAKYIANQIFDFARLGVHQMYLYKLVDDSSRDGDTEGNFGVFYKDGSVKPAAVMLGNLKHLLSINVYDDPANLKDTAPVTAAYNAAAFSVSGGDRTTRNLVMPKSNGSTMIAVWNETAIDDGRGTSLTPAPQLVTLRFGSAQTYSVHDLMGPSPLTGQTVGGKQFATGEGVMVALQGYPMLVELVAR